MFGIMIIKENMNLNQYLCAVKKKFINIIKIYNKKKKKKKILLGKLF